MSDDAPTVWMKCPYEYKPGHHQRMCRACFRRRARAAKARKKV